jgi:hypothetical protein
MTTTAADSFTLLDFAPAGTYLHHDADAPLAYAVWCDGDIIGAGESASEAVAEARRTVRVWEDMALRSGGEGK